MMTDELKLFFFWAKTARQCEPRSGNSPAASPPFHPLIYHLLDVAACAEALLISARSRVERLAKHCNVSPDDLSACFIALVALHDIGKCARGFQGKVLELWPDFLGSLPDGGLSVRHDAAGVWLFCEGDGLAELLGMVLPPLSPSMRLKVVQAICGHHGEPIDTNFFDIPNPNKTVGRDADKAAGLIAHGIVDLLKQPCCPLDDRFAPLVSLWLAGLTVVSDWLGSNQTWFAFRPPPTQGDLASNMKEYWEQHARPRADCAIRAAGLRATALSTHTGIRSIFGESYCPTPLQSYAETVVLPEGPLLFLIEDMTGAGKTEAAVVLAHRLMLAGKATGLHIALPTMATANAMFTRLASAYRRLFDETQTPSIVLTHGRRELLAGFALLPASLAKWDGSGDTEDDPSEIEASAFCADWLARSNKQAFLAQVGAGTIDQSILSVLPARHQSMRLWGLADKVLVIDEAHAYDAYMSKEIERLLRFQAAFGGSAIVLSATLPQDKRASLANAFLEGATERKNSAWRPSESGYPLVTSVSIAEIKECSLALREALAREVKVERIGTLEEAYRCALKAAKAGAAVAIVRNTVDEAIASYETISKSFKNTLLFHARFAMGDRQEIEATVLECFGKAASTKRNAILVATQVVEQSLDLDFDLIISDLAPIDLLIQRAGRLWRHVGRARRPGLSEPKLLVFSPEPKDNVDCNWPAPELPKTIFVYKDAAMLWRSAKAIFNEGKIVSKTSRKLEPAESGTIRALIEAVYGKDPLTIPDSLQGSEKSAIGRASADRTIAGHKLLELETGYDWAGSKWESDSRVETRLGDEIITLRLGRMEDDRVVSWISCEDRDGRRSWSLSEVSLRKSRCSAVRNPPETAEAIEAVQHGWTISERELPVLVLKAVDLEKWEGRVCDKDGKAVRVLYSKISGFRFSAEEA